MPELKDVFLNKLFLIILILFSSSSFSSIEVAKEALAEYIKVFDDHQVEKIEKVFSKKYLKELGGKSELEKRIKTLKKNKIKYEIEIKKTHKKDAYKARYKTDSELSKWFIIKKEDNTFKIFGTIEE